MIWNGSSGLQDAKSLSSLYEVWRNAQDTPSANASLHAENWRSGGWRSGRNYGRPTSFHCRRYSARKRDADPSVTREFTQVYQFTPRGRAKAVAKRFWGERGKRVASLVNGASGVATPDFSCFLSSIRESELPGARRWRRPDPRPDGGTKYPEPPERRPASCPSPPE